MEEETPVHSLPVLGEPAPDFDAVTTLGPIRLSDYRGKWVVLFSHPADFTPVCTTEFMAFAKAADDLESLNVQLIGLSVDSIPSHLAWIRNIQEKTGVRIPFPVIADLDMRVATLYGMIHPRQSGTATIRAVFFIDPEGIVRAMIYYPLHNGRSIPEIIRLVKALQATDRYGIATPADWEPGDRVVIPPPKNTREMEKRLEEGYDCLDWYLCFREI
jgi:peroxiredoxin (alkyl hydroperoxide reductase subunit C)